VRDLKMADWALLVSCVGFWVGVVGLELRGGWGTVTTRWRISDPVPGGYPRVVEVDPRWSRSGHLLVNDELIRFGDTDLHGMDKFRLEMAAVAETTSDFRLPAIIRRAGREQNLSLDVLFDSSLVKQRWESPEVWVTRSPNLASRAVLLFYECLLVVVGSTILLKPPQSSSARPFCRAPPSVVIGRRSLAQ
jgi:hypothetical protein